MEYKFQTLRSKDHQNGRKQTLFDLISGRLNHVLYTQTNPTYVSNFTTSVFMQMTLPLKWTNTLDSTHSIETFEKGGEPENNIGLNLNTLIEMEFRN